MSTDEYNWRTAPACLYRIYNEAKELIYIGVTNGPRARINEHRSWQTWGDEIKDWTEEWFDRRPDAIEAENAAIRAEKPKYNIVQTPLHREQCLKVGAARREANRQQLAAVDAVVDDSDFDSADDAIKAAMADYKRDLNAALERRDERIRTAIERFELLSKDVEKITGYSRETVRQIRNPEIRAAMRQSPAARQAGR